MNTLMQLPYALISSYQEQRTSQTQKRDARVQTYNSIADSLRQQDFSLRTYDPQRKQATIDVITTPEYEQLVENITLIQGSMRTPLQLIGATSIGGRRTRLFPNNDTTDSALTYARFGADLGYVTLIGEQDELPFALRLGQPKPLKKNTREFLEALRKGFNRADDTLTALLGR